MPPERSAGPPCPRPLQISIVWHTRRRPSVEPLLRRIGRHVASAEGFHRGQLCVAIVNQQDMQKLHRRFYGTAKAGDVLAFDLGCNRRTGQLQADIVICADVARKYCQEALRLPPGTTPGRNRRLRSALHAELALYLTHGILHLAGYNDHRLRDFRRMRARQERLLADCGLHPLSVPGCCPPAPLAAPTRQERRAARRK